MTDKISLLIIAMMLLLGSCTTRNWIEEGAYGAAPLRLGWACAETNRMGFVVRWNTNLYFTTSLCCDIPDAISCRTTVSVTTLWTNGVTESSPATITVADLQTLNSSNLIGGYFSTNDYLVDVTIPTKFFKVRLQQ